MSEGEEPPIWFSLLFVGAGLFIMVTAVWGSDEGFHAPRWVVAAAGGVFLLGGLMVVGQRFPLFSRVAATFMITAFAAVFVWVSFLPGERQFTSTLSIPFLSFSRSSPDLMGRLCFAPGAIFLAGLSTYMWFDLVRDWLYGEVGDDG